MGRFGRIERTREMVVQHPPYILTYQVTGKTIRILRVLRDAQRWPEETPAGMKRS